VLIQPATKERADTADLAACITMSVTGEEPLTLRGRPGARTRDCLAIH
jgi:hypothetical protein